jgi:hypothetical protein
MLWYVLPFTLQHLRPSRTILSQSNANASILVLTQWHPQLKLGVHMHSQCQSSSGNPFICRPADWDLAHGPHDHIEGPAD